MAQAEREREGCLSDPSHLRVAQGSPCPHRTQQPPHHPLQNVVAQGALASSGHPLKINSLLQDPRTNLHFSVAEEHGV